MAQRKPRPAGQPADTEAGMAWPLRRASPLTLLALALAATAGPLADPTRPPAALSTAEVGTRAPAPVGRRAPVVAAVPAPPPLPPLPPLQSLHLPAQGQAQALVGGQLVKTGDTVAGREVLAIDSQGLLLRSAAGEERLSLLGGTPKQAAGSILATRSAQFTPAAAGNEAAAPAGEIDPQPRTDRLARGEQAAAPQARPVTPGPLSLAGKNPP